MVYLVRVSLVKETASLVDLELHKRLNPYSTIGAARQEYPQGSSRIFVTTRIFPANGPCLDWFPMDKGGEIRLSWVKKQCHHGWSTREAVLSHAHFRTFLV